VNGVVPAHSLRNGSAHIEDDAERDAEYQALAKLKP